MEMELIYRILGENDRHILASQISHLRDICKEIQGFIAADRLDHLLFESYVPGRLRGIPQILQEIYQRFGTSVRRNRIEDENVKKFEQNFRRFVALVDDLQKGMDKFGRNSADLITYTNALEAFFQRGEFYVEDVQ